MDELVLWLRVILSLGAVLVLLWLIQRRVAGNVGTAARNSRPLQLIARQGIGQKASVVIVEADGQRLLLGVTEQSVTVISSAEAPATENVPEAAGQGQAEVSASTPAEGTTAIGRERRERRRTREQQSSLEGSILSLKTWQDSAEALKNGADSLKNGSRN